MAMMAAHVNVPAKDMAEGRATPGLGKAATLGIHYALQEPSQAFTAVPYRHHWFWIDDRDLKTKRAFGLLMMLHTLTDTGEGPPLPLITIPAQ